MGAYDPVTDTKHCPKCDTRLGGTHFTRRKNHGKDPYSPYCRDCAHKSYRTWVAKNRPAKIEYLKKRRLLKQEEYRQYDAARWKRPEVKERRREVVRANRARYSSYAHARRAREVSAPGRFTSEDVARIRRAQGDKCAVCRCPLKGKGHLDHIQPLAKGGSNYPWNLQWLCKSCNPGKGDTDPLVYMQRKGFLL
jgi:5-methylcytosine-specific restriction endonuclease McrA